MSRMGAKAALAALMIIVSGCAPALKPLPAGVSSQPPLAWRTQLATTATLELDWWRRFGDSHLTELVEKARANNLDVRIAWARVDEARATEAISRSLLLPTVEGGVQGGAQREVSAFGQGQNALALQPLFRASYEIDLFGRNAVRVEGAEAATAANEAAREATLLSVSAATASGYVTLLALDGRLDILKRTLQARGDALKFARDRASVGYTSQLELRQAEAEYQATALLVPQVETQIARQENALSILVGELPAATIRGGTLSNLKLPAAPDVLPSELLHRRPDVAAAEYQLAASDAQMRFARAKFLPTIGISATAGAAFSDLLANSVSIWSLGGSVLAPIFAGGRLTGEYDAAAARRDQAAFAYRSTVLNAFREVEDRMVTLDRLAAQKEALMAQRTAVADALRHARNRYQAGYTAYIEQVDAQRSLLGVELSIIQLEADMLNATIGLYQAAGGRPEENGAP